MEWKNVFDEDAYNDIENLEDVEIYRDGIVFAIDIKCYDFLIKIFESLRDWMLRDILSSDKNFVGVILFNTEITKNQNDFKNIYILQNFDTLGAERIKNIEKVIEDISKNKVSHLFGKLDHHFNASLAELLWLCSNIFLQSKYKFGNKKIYFFTREDNPFTHDGVHKKQAIQRAHDLNELDIEIEIVGFPTGSKKFDFTLFFQDLLALSDEDIETYPTYEGILEELRSRIRVKDYRKRAISKIPFVIGPNIIMAISVYALVSSTSISPPVKLDKDSLEEIVKPEIKISQETGDISPDENAYMEYGGAKIIFEHHEIRQLKDFGPPNLTLLGFKPLSFVKPYWFVRPNHFIYPDEKKILGSTKLFRALLLRCIDRSVVPICLYVSRRFSVPYIVALIPQLEKFDDNEIQMEPSGFHVKYLPYAEDFRKVPYPPSIPDMSNSAKYSTVLNKAKEIVQHLKFNYSITDFENPVLQRHYRVLEALALDRPSLKIENDSYQDSTLPNYKIIEERAGQSIREFTKILKINNLENLQAKEPKLSLTGKIDEKYIRKLYEKNELSRMTIPVLRQFCIVLNIQKSSGPKDSYVKVLKKYFESKQ